MELIGFLIYLWLLSKVPKNADRAIKHGDWISNEEVLMSYLSSIGYFDTFDGDTWDWKKEKWTKQA